MNIVRASLQLLIGHLRLLRARPRPIRKATIAPLLAVCAAAVGFVEISVSAVAAEAMRQAPIDAPSAMLLAAQQLPQPASQRFAGDNLESRTAAIAALMRKQHPHWRDLTLTQQLWKIGMLAKGLLGVPNSTATGVAPLANFSGNLTGITAPSPKGLYLQRQVNCSLNLNTANYSIVLNGATSFTLSNTETTPSYEKALHDIVQLPTNAGGFANGCAEATLGVGSRPAVYLGRSSQNLQVVVAARYYAPKGTNALYYLTADASSNAVRTFAVDTSEPNISAVAAGDLNGDGLADIVGIDGLGSSASVTVRIAKADGTFGAGAPYPLPGTVDEAAVLEDVNGDGKPDVIVATIDTNTRQEYISVLTGKGDGTLNAAVSFTVSTPTYLNSGGGNSPATIVNLIASDLRGNGRKDLVASNGLVLLNNGDGTFTPAAKAGFAPRSATSNYGPNLAAGDLNGDRKTDLVVNNGAQIDIYLGNGDGTFNKGRSYATLDSVGYVSVTDIDGDGSPDIYVGLGNGGFFFGDQFGAGQAYALMGNGDGTFKGAPAATGAYQGQNLVDLNGDKKLDLVGVDGNTFTTYLGNADGAFTPGATLSVPSFTFDGKTYSNPGVGAFTLVDVNGDGYPDLVWIPAQGTVDVSSARSFYLVALNKHDGSFSSPTVTEFPTLASGSDFETYFAVTSVQAADFNNDGKADLIFSFSSATYTGTSYQVGYFVLGGKGDGTFGTPKALITSTAALGSFSPPLPPTAPAAIVDVNGDHFPDLVVVQGTGVGTLPGGGQGSRLVLFRGKGDGTFGAASVVTAAPNPFSARGFVVAADMNGDGRPDLVTLGQAEADGNGYLAISLGNGDGSFAAPTTYVLQAQGITFDGIAVADFDGDGKNDVALTNFEVPGGILLGKGDGTLATPYLDSGNVMPSLQFILQGTGATTAADLNGDGVPDIIAGNVAFVNLSKNSSIGSGPLNLNQHGLTGAWYNPATGGQGFLIETYPNFTGSGQGYLAMGWYTFDVTAAGGQRWYTLQGPATSGAATASLSINAASAGNFNAGPKITSTQVGSATLSFTDCTHGSLSYSFSDGSARSGTIPLTRLDANVTCTASGDDGSAAANFLLSGAWYNPSTSGQGFFFDINPAQNLLFAAWYTYAPNGATIGGGASQRWYTIQDNAFGPGLKSKNGLAIYETTGGVFNSGKVGAGPPIGSANIVISSCTSITLSYTFTGGTNAGLSGSIDLGRVVGAPSGCSL